MGGPQTHPDRVAMSTSIKFILDTFYGFLKNKTPGRVPRKKNSKRQQTYPKTIPASAPAEHAIKRHFSTASTLQILGNGGSNSLEYLNKLLLVTL
jgi:hypothetical protein